MQQLRAAAEAARADDRARRQGVERREVDGEQRIARRGPRGHGGEHQPGHGFGRQVLEAVDGQVDLAAQQRLLNLLGEQPAARLAVDRAEWRSPLVEMTTISTAWPCSPSRSGDPLGLPASQRTAAGT